MTELGEIELSVPRTRTFSALAVERACARRAAQCGAFKVLVSDASERQPFLGLRSKFQPA